MAICTALPLPDCTSLLTVLQVDEPYRNIPTEQLKQKVMRDKAPEKVRV